MVHKKCTCHERFSEFDAWTKHIPCRGTPTEIERDEARADVAALRATVMHLEATLQRMSETMSEVCDLLDKAVGHGL